MRLTEFRESHRQLGLSDFCRRFDHPFLVVFKHDAADRDRAFRTAVITDSWDAVAPDEEDAEVHPIDAAGGAGIVSVGRAGNMKIVLKSSAISKMHCFFRRHAESGDWMVADAGSTNGTKLNGKSLGTTGDDSPVRSGDQLDIGGVFAAVFVDTEALYHMLFASANPADIIRSKL